DRVEGSGTSSPNVYRIARNEKSTGTLLSNIAWKDMPLSGKSGAVELDGEDGLDNDMQQLEEGTAGNTLQWDIAGVWLISAGAYPKLRWQ
ncbi:MAG: hypothetical protein LBI90_02500, partial [Treponema sp.]|nr:hypothetical protein [Treponema sp.]